MNQPPPPWHGHQPHSPVPYQEPHRPTAPWPYERPAYAPMPHETTPRGGGAFRYVALACGTLVVLGALVLAGLMLVPRTPVTPVAVAGTSSGTATGNSAGSGGSGGASGPVIATVAAPTADPSVPDGAYSCGSTGSGHTVVVENGTVPCDHALMVAEEWLETGSTPSDGVGAAGTMYSWTCSSTGGGGGWCTSKMGSHLSIGA